MNINNPVTPPGAFRLPALLIRLTKLVIWAISITIGVALFFQLQSFTALFDSGPAILLAVGVVGVVVGAITGVVVMLLQLPVPIHRLIRTKRWAIGTLGAWSLAGATYEILFWMAWPLAETSSLIAFLSGPFVGVGIGLAFGLVQWLAAYRYVARAQWLLISNVIGWGLGYAVAILWLSATWVTALGLISSIVILGVIPGLITGITLSLLPARAIQGTETL